LELVALDQASARPYSGSFGGATLQQSLSAPVNSSLHEMRENVDGLQTTVRNTKIGAFGALLATALTLFLGLNSLIGDVRDRTSKLEGGFNPPTAVERSLRATVEDLCKEVNRLQRLRNGTQGKVVC
jgi:hypothetical protein